MVKHFCKCAVKFAKLGYLDACFNTSYYTAEKYKSRPEKSKQTFVFVS